MAAAKKKRNAKRDKTSVGNPVPIIRDEKPKKNRTMLIIVCIFLGIVLCLSGTLLTVTLIRNSRFVASYSGYGMEEGAARYFASAYKTDYIANLPESVRGLAESEGFWETIPEGGSISYGEDLRRGYENYIKRILIANALYTSGESFEEEIENALSYLTSAVEIGGSIDVLNEKTAEYGFDYDDLTDAAELYYRYVNACSSVYGAQGEYISVAGCSEYLKTYSYVKMIFINSNDISTKAEVASAVESLRASIAEGADMASEEQFDRFMKHNSIHFEGGVDGEYYFGINAEFTVKFGQTDKKMHAIVERALTMNIGEAAEMPYPNGICFIYKCTPNDSHYTNTSYDLYFDDFYVDAAKYLFEAEITARLDEVKIKDEFLAIDVVATPKNIFYRVKFD